MGFKCLLREINASNKAYIFINDPESVRYPLGGGPSLWRRSISIFDKEGGRPYWENYPLKVLFS